MTPREKLLNEQAGLRAEFELYGRAPPPDFREGGLPIMATAVSARRDYCVKRLAEIAKELTDAEAPETA